MRRFVELRRTSTRAARRYDTALAKALVREHLTPFFAARVAPDVVRSARVWYLPGAGAAETAAYRAAGIPQSALQAFEWDPSIAAAIRTASPDLSLHTGALGDFLRSRRAERATCDWANLDFDGIAPSFHGEIRAVVAHLRTDRCPRLGLSSFGSRDRAVLGEEIAALSALRAAIGSERFPSAFDLYCASNERGGYVPSEPVATTAVAREFAVLALVASAFGARTYGRGDAAAARAFRDGYGRTIARIRRTLRTAASRYLTHHGSLPLADAPAVANLFAQREIPVWIEDWLRFAYQTPNRRWMWTWYFRFQPLNGRTVPLAEWAQKLLLSPPPLHVVDRTGQCSPRAAEACAWCAAAARTVAAVPSAAVPSPPHPLSMLLRSPS